MLVLNKPQTELLVLICLVYVSWGLTDSIQAPFYPIQAEEMGASPAEYGLVFGIIHLAMFLAGPVFGHWMPKLGVRPVFIFGVLTTAICACAFGFLGFLPTKWSFLGSSYGLRVLEGLAEAGAWSSVITILAAAYGDRVTSVYSLTQASFGFAEILGPSVGGFMFEAGGFVLPFEFSGILCFIVGLFTIFRLPHLTNSSKALERTVSSDSSSSALDTPPSATQSLSSMRSMLSEPMVLLALLGTVFGAVCQGFVESFLEEYLAEFNLSTSQIGVSFLAMSVPYMLATPLWGWLADTRLAPELISPAGHLLIAVSLVLVGPPTYTHLPPDLIMTEVGLGLLGVGTAATITATFSLAQRRALDSATCSVSQATSLIAGLWTSAFAFGSFLGPTVGGPLVEWFSFPGTIPILQAWSLMMVLLDLLSLLPHVFQGEVDSGQLWGTKKQVYQPLD